MNSSFQYTIADERGFKGAMLDYLLAAGYYRMQHLMFTCTDTFISEDYKSIPVFWLRTLVNKYRISKSAKLILKKCSGFTVNIEPAIVDAETEMLYALYKDHVTFTISPTCKDYLHHPYLTMPFDSMMIKVRDKNRLIAVGVVDKGKDAIAGIMNIYHPDYAIFSLGKFLMLQKLKYAQSQAMKFYYTGYISTKITKFDYKVFPDIDAVQVFLPIEQQWVQYHILSKTFLEEYYSKFIR
ncbi:MAG: arginine-tRNA-protein transferase [Bacteroidetes bacterium]|nr:arginine-tRNA-protein transferase [Bacteroidota bacterium]